MQQLPRYISRRIFRPRLTHDERALITTCVVAIVTIISATALIAWRAEAADQERSRIVLQESMDSVFKAQRDIQTRLLDAYRRGYEAAKSERSCPQALPAPKQSLL